MEANLVELDEEAIRAKYAKVNAEHQKVNDEFSEVKCTLNTIIHDYDPTNWENQEQMNDIKVLTEEKHNRWREVSDKLIQISHECEKVRDEFMKVSDEFIKDKVKHEENKIKCNKILDGYKKTSANIIKLDDNINALYEIVGGSIFVEYCKVEEIKRDILMKYEKAIFAHETTIQANCAPSIVKRNFSRRVMSDLSRKVLLKKILHKEILIKQMMTMIGYVKTLIEINKTSIGSITISRESAMDALKKIDINIEHIITMTNSFEEAIECMKLDIENARTEENLKAAREERRLRIARACPSKAELLSATANIEKLYLTSKICDVMEILQNSSGRNVIEELLRHTQYDYIRDDVVEFYRWMDSQIPDIRSRFMKSCHGFVVQHGIEFFSLFVDYMMGTNNWFKSSNLTFKYFTSGLPLIKLIMYEFYMQYLSRTETNQELKDDLIEFCEHDDCYFHQITIDDLKKWHEKQSKSD